MENRNKVFAALVTAIMLFSFVSLAQILPVSATTPAGLSVHCNGSIVVATYTGSYNHCLISLVTGWNLISLPVVPVSTAVTASSVFYAGAANSVNNMFNKTQITSVTSVYTYNAKSGTWLFCKVTTLAAGCSGTLFTMVDGAGYWVLTASPVGISFNGYIIQPGAAPPAYTLFKGWNLVGFKPQPTFGSEETSTYLSSVTSSIDTAHVYSFDNTVGSWDLLGASDTIPPGNALWVFVTVTGPVTLYP